MGGEARLGSGWITGRQTVILRAMPVCSLCDHSQPAATPCEVCGREFPKLPAAARPPPPAQPVEGLEATRFQAAAAALDLAMIPELELTRLSAVGEVAAPRMEDMEVPLKVEGPVATELVADLERGRYVDADPRAVDVTRSPGATCRYCKHVQTAAGLTCEKCGMRRTRELSRKAQPADGALLCRICGSPGSPGARCGECGATLGQSG